MHVKRSRLIEARKKHGMTQGELAKAVGISRAYLTNIELGKYTPSLRTAHKIASVLGGTVEEFFCRCNVRETNRKKLA